MFEDNSYKPVQFMIVDDDDVSVMAIKRAMSQLNIVNPVKIAKDGIEALQILHSSLDENNSLPPYIITLDLSMPRMGGLEFLEAIRKESVFKKLIVFVLTTSDAPSDVASAYEKNIAGYIVKENPTESFREALLLIKNYAQLVVLPN